MRTAAWLVVAASASCGTIDHQIDWWSAVPGSRDEPAFQPFGGLQRDARWLACMVGDGAAIDAEWMMAAPALVLEVPCSAVGDVLLLPMTVTQQVWTWLRPAGSSDGR